MTTVLLCTALTTFGAYPVPLQASAVITGDAGLALDIPPGPLVDAVEQIAQQFGLDVLYNADQLKGLRTPGIRGRMSAMDAIHQILNGAGLAFIQHPDGAILITSIPEGHQSVARRPSAVESNPASAAVDAGMPDAIARQETALKTLVVTGTHIQGEVPVGSALSVHTRDDIERSGSATLEQFGRKMTENYSATDAIATLNTNGSVGLFEQGALSNVFGGAGFNLKGLGPGSTLTLVNGHRLAAGGLDGSTVDISQIPLSAIDHIEVLDDGASAIYGSDAVAGVVNIITRHDFDGAQSSVHYGRATQGGALETTASQALGTRWDGGNGMFDYEFDDQAGLDASQRSWISPQGTPFSLISKNRRHSFYAAGTLNATTDSLLSADLLYSERHFESNGIENTTDPFLDTLQRTSGYATQTLATVNFTQSLFDSWTAGLTGNYSRVRQIANGSPLGLSGEDANSTASQRQQAYSSLESVEIQLSGTAFDLPGHPIKLSEGAAYRAEQFNSLVTTGGAALPDSKQRNVESIYGEAFLPIVANGPPGLRQLELSAAYRYDQYQLFGSTHNPKIGWAWEPVAGLRVKGTAGTSFQAPLLSQLAAPITSYTASFPRTGSNAKDDVLIVTGGNPGLAPETATTISTGLDLEPADVPGLTTSLNFFWLKFNDRIQEQTILPQPILSQPQLSFISGYAFPGEAQPFFESPGFQGDGAGLGPGGVNLAVQNEFMNTLSTFERGVNASAHYRWADGYGAWETTFAAQYLLADFIRTASFAEDQSIDNTLGEPPRLKGRAGISWTAHAVAADLTINYVNAYRNTLFTPSQGIGAWTTADAYLGYSTPSNSSDLWEHVQIGLNIQNVFDRKPPSLQIPSAYLAGGRNPIPFDGANASPVGRELSLQFKKRW